MYQLAISRNFIAQHYLIGGDWGKENTKHSHQYKIEVLIESDRLDRHGYLMDIVELETSVDQTIDRFRDCTLNALEPFHNINPSLENFSRILWEGLTAQLQLNAKITVKLWENETDWASYTD